MNTPKIKDVFLKSEIDFFNNIINDINAPTRSDGSYIYNTEDPDSNIKVSKYLGRLEVSDCFMPIPQEIHKKLSNISSVFFDSPHDLSSIVFVEYSNLYGEPNLPPHFDGDRNDLIINYQLSSNTSWDVGVGLKNYQLEDNTALLFNGNTNIHWRPKKIFNDGEYVKMLFFRFCKIEDPSVYPDLSDEIKNEMFLEVYKFMDTINQ